MDIATTSGAYVTRDGVASCATHVTVILAVMALKDNATKERVFVVPAGTENTAL